MVTVDRGAESSLERPFVLGFYRNDPFAPQLVNTATVAVLHAWCHAEGYTLGVPFLDRAADNGAFEALMDALLSREDVVGVVTPTLDHLGPNKADRIADITATGKGLFVAYESAP